MSAGPPTSSAEHAPSMRGWLSTAPGLAGIEFGRLSRPIAGPGTALVRVEAAALNFSDLLMIDDHYQIRPPRPFVPGQEIAGTVVSAAENSGLAGGNRVASKVEWGGVGEYAVVRGGKAVRILRKMRDLHAAALPVVQTEYIFN